MPALFISSLVGALAAAMGSLAGRVLLALGMGFVTYKGIDVGIGTFKQYAMDGVKGMPVDAVNLVGYLWIDKAISVVFSAIATAISMRALGGSIKKMVAK